MIKVIIIGVTSGGHIILVPRIIIAYIVHIVEYFWFLFFAIMVIFVPGLAPGENSVAILPYVRGNVIVIEWINKCITR
jgi:hypothetical protein